jgi:hypothetical protein
VSFTESIPSTVAEELYEVGDADQAGDWTRVTDVEGDSGRWEQHHTLVIRHKDGQHYGIRYSIGLTEYQDSTFPWKGDGWNPAPESVPVFRLYPHEVTRIEYRTTAPGGAL